MASSRSGSVNSNRKSSSAGGGSSTGRSAGAANGRKRSRNNRPLIILGVLVAILIVLIIIAIFILTRSKPEETVERDFSIDVNEEDEDDLFSEDDIILDDDLGSEGLEAIDSEVTVDEGWLHYLLLGVDGEGSGYTGKRSDAMIVLSVNKDEGRVILSSIPRDTLVYIEGKGFDKLTHAYAYGGASLTVETFEENFDIHIENYITVNFRAMEKIVDEVGGVTLTLTAAEAKEMGDRYAAWDLSAGTQKLNGKQTLAYCRVRYIDSDYARNERQYKALIAIYEAVKNASVTTYTSMISDIWDDIYTDLTLAEAISLAGDLLSITKTAEIENVKLVDSEHSKTGWYSSKSVVYVDNLVNTATRWREALGIDDYEPSARLKQISAQLSQLG